MIIFSLQGSVEKEQNRAIQLRYTRIDISLILCCPNALKNAMKFGAAGWLLYMRSIQEVRSSRVLSTA